MERQESLKAEIASLKAKNQEYKETVDDLILEEIQENRMDGIIQEYETKN